jgi:hypothetical protein
MIERDFAYPFICHSFLDPSNWFAFGMRMLLLSQIFPMLYCLLLTFLSDSDALTGNALPIQEVSTFTFFPIIFQNTGKQPSQ